MSHIITLLAYLTCIRSDAGSATARVTRKWHSEYRVFNITTGVVEVGGAFAHPIFSHVTIFTSFLEKKEILKIGQDFTEL